MIESLLWYHCDGPHYIVMWSHFDDESGPVIVVARSTNRGRRWMRALRKIGAPGWHITAHRTKLEAVQGRQIPRKGLRR